VDQINTSMACPAGCPDNCTGCAGMRHLFLLAARLPAHGPDVHLGTCDLHRYAG
jgi:hypothetical protein